MSKILENILNGTYGKTINKKRRFLGSLIKGGLILRKNVLIPLCKTVLNQDLGLTAIASAADIAIQKESYKWYYN